MYLGILEGNQETIEPVFGGIDGLESLQACDGAMEGVLSDEL